MWPSMRLLYGATGAAGDGRALAFRDAAHEWSRADGAGGDCAKRCVTGERDVAGARTRRDGKDGHRDLCTPTLTSPDEGEGGVASHSSGRPVCIW